MKTREQIAAETIGAPRSQRRFNPAPDYIPHAKLNEWDATLPNTSVLTRDDFIRSVEPRNDRILVQLLPGDGIGGVRAQNQIMLTDAKPLIGGCRKARVLKTGPGRWIEGEWWCFHKPDINVNAIVPVWEWIYGYRRPVSVSPGQVVLIGNWVDLELEDIALCQEMDVRSIWQN